MDIFVKNDFYWYEQIKYVENLFINLFGGDVELKDFYYGQKAMGAFSFVYYYRPKNIKLIFHYENTTFEVSLERKDGIRNYLQTICNKDSTKSEIDFPLPYLSDFSAIDFYMNILKRILEEDNIKFYKVEVNGQDSKWVPIDD